MEQYGRRKGFQTFTPIVPASFMEAFLAESFCQSLGGFPWFKRDTGEYLLATPPYGGDERMPWVSVEDDFGDIVHGIFLDPDSYHLKTIQGSSELISFEKMVEDFMEGT